MQGKATKRKNPLAMTVVICGEWKPGGGSKKVTAECTYKVKWYRLRAIYPLDLAGLSGRLSQAFRKRRLPSQWKQRAQQSWLRKENKSPHLNNRSCYCTSLSMRSATSCIFW